MKINKEIRYNIIIICILIIIDLLWNFISSNRDIFKYPFVLFNVSSNICFYVVYIINYRFLAPIFLAKQQFLRYAFFFLILIFVFALLRYFLEEILIYSFIGQHNYNFLNDDLIVTYLFDAFYYTFRFSLYSSVVYFLFRYHENKDKIHQLNSEQQKAQLRTLKSQLSPHFLFNTLNNFYVELYDKQPETAEAILRLSNLLRYITYETDQDFSLLQKEIVFIKDYIYFFERRYEENFHVYLVVNGTITNQKIPSLILIHFIENVFKHGIIDTKENPAMIEINCTNTFIEITTTNQINNSEKYMEKGIGSKNIEKRLQLFFENKYILNYQKENNNYKAYLKFPICQNY